jgi:hypothetical protein
MAPRSKQPYEPVGIERLLELLNEAEGLAERGPPPSRGSEASESEAPPAQLGEAEMPESPEVTVEQMPGDHESAEADDDLENRFAAHIVRGMSKSKNG